MHRLAARAFALVELIIVILILIMLAAIAIVGLDRATASAHRARAQASLSAVTKAVSAQGHARGISVLDRALFLEAIEVHIPEIEVLGQGPGASAKAWSLLMKDASPEREGDFALAFDRGPGTPSSDNGGTRAAIVTADARGALWAQELTVHSGVSAVEPIPAGSTPASVLAGDDNNTPPQVAPGALVMTIDTRLPLCLDRTISLPALGPDGQFSIDWGDAGTGAAGATASEHQYAHAGQYTINVYGNVTNLNHRGDERAAQDVACLRRVDVWSGMRPVRDGLVGAFEGARNLESVPSDLPQAPELWLSRMFLGAQRFTGSVGAWDTSRVTRMDEMFAVTSFSEDLSGWDTSRVTTIKRMFRDAEFNGDVSTWDVSNVEDMNGTFLAAENFNQDLSHWDTSSVLMMNETFRNAKAFNQNLSSWAVAQVAPRSRLNFDTNALAWTLPRPAFK